MAIVLVHVVCLNVGEFMLGSVTSALFPHRWVLIASILIATVMQKTKKHL